MSGQSPSSAIKPVRVGVLGAGSISDVYLHAIDRSPALQLVCIAIRRPEGAVAKSARFGVPVVAVDTLLADDSVELILNLTPGIEHETLNKRIPSAGKHLYTEKPFALSRRLAEELVELAVRENVSVGSAPDTFYGAAHQAVRAALDRGDIGQPVFGLSLVAIPGLEFFHPNPAQFYQSGGEPPFDVGPYYITNWINLLRPIRQVYASAGSSTDRRTGRRGPMAGQSFPVEVPTTFNTILEFANASVNLVLSLDAASPALRHGELYGSAGTLSLADPLFFGGAPELTRSQGERTGIAIAELPFSKPNRENHFGVRVGDYRGVGLVDLAISIRTGRAHRTGPNLLIHVVEVMEAILTSARERRMVALSTTCDRPKVIDPIDDSILADLSPSPFDMPPISRD